MPPEANYRVCSPEEIKREVTTTHKFLKRRATISTTIGPVPTKETTKNVAINGLTSNIAKEMSYCSHDVLSSLRCRFTMSYCGVATVLQVTNHGECKSMDTEMLGSELLC